MAKTGGVLTCICICTVGMLAFIAKADYAQLANSLSQKPSLEDTNKQSSEAHFSKSNFEQITKLFGQIIVAPKEAQPKQNLPETRLDLTLKGTFTHKDSDKASALIAENSKSTARFFVGDEIPGGAELIAVRKGEITLRRNGQDELLKLPFLKTDERIAKNSKRRAASAQQTNSSSRHSQVEYSTDSNKSLTNITNNSRQQQLKDRLAKLRNNRSRNTSSPN